MTTILKWLEMVWLWWAGDPLKAPAKPQQLLAISFPPARDLCERIQVTARCRFAAASRLEKIDRDLTWLTALSSGYLIVITAMPYILSISVVHADVLNVVSIFLSVVILVSSLLQYARARGVNAEQHHRASLEMNEIARDLLGRAALTDEKDFEKANSSYNSILQKYSINHEKIDHYYVQLERPHEFPWNGQLKRLSMKGSIIMKTGIPLMMVTLMTAAFVAIFAFYIWHRLNTATSVISL